MKSKRERRKRIDPGEIIGEIVVDTDAFIKNKSSGNAKRIVTVLEHIEIDIYFDKHYFIRHQHGDSEGKRNGIEIENVRALVIEAAKHLFFYSVKVRGFSFVNFEVIGNPQRVVLTQESGNNDDDLNIVVEYHYLSMNKYEVTLITAIRKDNFHFHDGGFQIVLRSDGTSNLYKKERGKASVISHYDNE